MAFKGGIVYGVGITDVPIKENDKVSKAYTAWRNMLQRCYCEDRRAANPTYVGCTVAAAWQTFSCFKKWFDKNYVEGFALDKDLLVEGNKVYSDSTCAMVPVQLNALFLDRGGRRGPHAQGVCLFKRVGKFVAYISRYGVLTHLGYFDKESDAHAAWVRAKKAYANELADLYLRRGQISVRLHRALLRRARSLK